MKSYKMCLVLFFNAILIVLRPIAALKCEPMNTRNKDPFARNKDCYINGYNPVFVNNFELDPVYIDGSIENLTFYNSTIMELSASICMFGKTMRKVDFTECQVYRVLPSTFAFCSYLYQITLRHNFISDLPDATFIDTKHLSIIDLSYNRITQIGGSLFKNLNYLISLDLSHNKLVFIPSTIFPGNLETLNLGFNQLSSFSARELPYIRSLGLDNNVLTSLTLNSRIRSLSAANNFLQSTNIFSNSTKLNTLSLGNNLFNNFDAIKNLSNLRFLDFSSNLIQNVNLNLNQLDSFSEIIYIEALNISSNNLTIFNTLPRFKTVNNLILTNNYLNATSFERLHYFFPQLYSIEISRNNWNCNDLMSVLKIIDNLWIILYIGVANLIKSDTINIRGIQCTNDTENVNKLNKSELITLDPVYVNYTHEFVNTKGVPVNEAVQTKIVELQIIRNKLEPDVKYVHLIILILGLSLTFLFYLLCKKVFCNKMSTTINYKILEV